MTRGSAPAQVRRSGETAADEVATELGNELDTTVEPQLPEERATKFRTPGFHRMRTDWTPEERVVVDSVRQVVEQRVLDNFKDAYNLMNDLFDIVREPERDAVGNVVRDHFGFMKWKRSPLGGWVEDWTKLTLKQRENFLFQITTRIFDWEQRAADAWGEAMLAKAMWEERFSIGFDAPEGRKTVEDRTAHGRIEAREERYLAIFMTMYSKKADSVVKSMERLGQRIKDAMQA